jgi:hypothetical protein
MKRSCSLLNSLEECRMEKRQVDKKIKKNAIKIYVKREMDGNL